MPRATTSTTAPRSSTSTWAARRRRSATGWRARRCCATKAWSARILDAVVQRGRRAGDAQVPHRLGHGKPERAARRAHRGTGRRPAPRDPRPHPRLRLRRHAEYDTIREVKAATRLPVIANGDITTPEDAKRVLDYTGADGVMIGRAAQGAPWIFREIEHYLATGRRLPPPPRRRDPRRCCSRTCRAVRVLRRGGGRAHRPQAHLLVHERACRIGAVQAGAEPDRVVRGAARGGGALLRRARATVKPTCVAITKRSWRHEADLQRNRRDACASRSSVTSRTSTANGRARSTTWC